MKRTTAPNNVGNKYIDRVGSTPGTILQAEDRNNLQEEICNLLEGYGVTLDGGNDEQLKELFLSYLNQGVKTTDDVQFGDLTVDGEILLTESPTDGQWSLPVDTYITIPRGIYNIQLDVSVSNYGRIRNATDLTTYCDGADVNVGQRGICFISDGSSYEIGTAGTGGTGVTKYQKF